MLLIWALFPAALLAAVGLGVFFVIGILRRIRSAGPENGRTLQMCLPGCFLLPLLALILLLFGVPLLIGIRPASWDFEDAFGRSPGSAITGLRGHTDNGLDASNIFLSFDASMSAITFLDRSFASSARVEETDMLDSAIFGGMAPSWFAPAARYGKPGPCAGREAREYRDWHGWRSVVIIRCPKIGRIYAFFWSAD